MSNAITHEMSRSRWAVSLCFASTVLMVLEASRSNSCAWLGLNADQSFALSAILATLTAFMAAFILTQLINHSTVAR